MVAEAQRVIGDFQERFRDNVALLDEAHARPLIASARVLESTAEAPRLELSDEARAELLLMSAAAHAMYGNGPASFVSTQKAISLLQEITPALAAGIATLAPRLIATVGSHASTDGPESEYLELLNDFIATGDARSESRLDEAMRRTMLAASGAFEGALLRSARLALAQVRTLSCSRALQDYTAALPQGYLQRLIDKGHPTLLPPQHRAIAFTNFLRTQSNSIISLPTSTGKTLLAELALLVSLRRQTGLAVYIAPYVALGGQVLSVLRDRVGEDVHVFPQLGGYAAEGTPDPEVAPTVLVATPEGFDSLLRQRPSLLDCLRCVVVDEAHMLGSGVRGLRLEGLITRLRLRQVRGHSIRLVLLSAALGSIDTLATWLGVDDRSIIREEWRPTARRLAVWTEAGRLSWLQADDPVAPPGVRPDTVVWAQDLP